MGALGCRVWAEYTPGPDNVADPLSRDGLEDIFVAAKIAAGVWRFLPPSAAAASSVLGLTFENIWTHYACA